MKERVGGEDSPPFTEEGRSDETFHVLFHEGKEGKEARFEKQDVADENFARDNYKYEAEKDVR